MSIRFVAGLFVSVVFIFINAGSIKGQDKADVKATPPAKLDSEALKKVGTIAGFKPNSPLGKYVLDFNAPLNAELQKTLEAFDYELRGKYEFESASTAVGLLDLKTLRLATINPDEAEYSPSAPKAGVILAYFQLHPEAATNLDPKVRTELGQIAKAANHELTAHYSQQLGLKTIQEVLNAYDLYNQKHGGLWVGKHYGRNDEINYDPRDNLSHATTVRQLLRYFLLLEQGKLVSPEASKVMRQIFESPELPHNDVKFVKALSGRNVEIIRKWGSWETHQLDSGVVIGSNRHYILVAMAKHLDADAYLRDMAVSVDNLMKESAAE